MILQRYFLILIFISSVFSLKAQDTYKDQIDLIQNARMISFDSTLKLINETRVLFKDSLETCDNQAAFYRQIFFYHYFKGNLRQSANTLIDSLLPIQKSCYPENDYRIALSNYNLGKVYSNLHEFSQAKEYYKRCVQLLNYLNENSARVAHKYGAIGQFYLDLEDYEKGLYYLRKAEIIYDKNQDFGKRYIMFMHSKGAGERHLKQYEKSINTFEKCLIKLNEGKNNDPTHKSRVYHDLAITEFEDNKIKSAKQNIKLAIELSKARNFKLLLSLHYDFLANIYTFEKQYEKAIATYFKSNELIIDPENNATIEQISGSFENLAGAYFGTGELVKALETYQEGMHYLSPNLDSNFMVNPKILDNTIISKTYLRRQLGLKAKALYNLGLQNNQKSAYLSTIDAIQKYDSLTVMLLNEDWGEKSHLNLIQVANESYKYALDAAQALDENNNQEKYTLLVYEMVSKLKARLLSRGIIQKDIKAKQLSDSLFVLDKSYLARISNTNTALLKAEQEGQNVLRDSLFEIYFTAVEDYNLFKEQNLATKAQTFDFRENKLENIQKYLNEETAIFEYFLSDKKLVCFIVTSNDFKLITSKIDLVELEENIQLQKNGKDIPLAFSQLILNGIKDLAPKINKLIIIPDHELLALPFEALNVDNESFLIEKFDVVYEYSIDFLLKYDKKSGTNKMLVALASNYETASFDAIKENKFFNPDEIKFSSLNFAINEIEYANKRISGYKWINEQATKQNLLNNIESAGVIHLGLHGLLNNDFPDQSGLVFHPKEGENVEDFLLTSAEIYNLDISPSITILSACNSGAGKLHDGDGLRSIARSFIHAGSRSILMSLWEAPDVSTNQIIQGVYDNLEKGNTMSKALQKAKLDYIENATPSFKHPKYWAHLVLVGNAPPLGSDDKMLYYLLPVLILVIGLFYFKRRS